MILQYTKILQVWLLLGSVSPVSHVAHGSIVLMLENLHIFV